MRTSLFGVSFILLSLAVPPAGWARDRTQRYARYWYWTAKCSALEVGRETLAGIVC